MSVHSGNMVKENIFPRHVHKQNINVIVNEFEGLSTT